MKRLVALAVVAISALAGRRPRLTPTPTPRPCARRGRSCASTRTTRSAQRRVHGHDEPTVHFTRTGPGTGGNDLTYTMTLPKNPPVKPNQAGTAGTCDFQLRATFWLGLTMCDSAVVAELHSRRASRTATRTRGSRARTRARRTTSASIRGTRSWSCSSTSPATSRSSTGFGCSATQWCANLTIDSLSDQDNTGVQQNADCLNNHFLVGEEPVNWAYITKSGKSQAPANPLALSDDPNLDRA